MDTNEQQTARHEETLTRLARCQKCGEWMTPGTRVAWVDAEWSTPTVRVQVAEHFATSACATTLSVQS